MSQEGVSLLEWRKTTAELAQRPSLGGGWARPAAHGPRPGTQRASLPAPGGDPWAPLAEAQAFPSRLPCRAPACQRGSGSDGQRHAAPPLTSGASEPSCLSWGLWAKRRGQN